MEDTPVDGQHMNRNETYLNLSGLNKLPMIHQSENTECGLACLAMIAAFYGYKVDLVELRQRFTLGNRGTDLVNLANIASRLSLSNRVIRCSVSELGQLRTPCILHWDFTHFVVLRSVNKNSVTIHDPAVGVKEIQWEELSKKFTGIALELFPSEEFKRKPKAPILTLSRLIRFDRSFFSSFSLGLILSFIGELFILAAPFYLQVVVDEVLMKGDNGLLASLAVGFAVLVVLGTVASSLRMLTFQYLGHILSFDMAARVFHRMMKLPVNYFTSRQLGDIQHRVQSIKRIKNFLVSGAPLALMDGFFSILILIILFIYSKWLTLVVLSAVLLYLVFRLSMFTVTKRAAGDLIIAEAETQTQLLESLRSISTIKMLAIERHREGSWLNVNSRRFNAGIRVGNLDIISQSFNTILFGLLRVAVIFVAATAAINGDLTVGMITAFMAYYTMFTERVIALVDQFIAMKLLQVPLKRLADIVFSRAEETGDEAGRSQELIGAVAVQALRFRYSQTSDDVLKNINIRVKSGEFVAITGPSGTGKTTLLKLISGIETPTQGEILFDGRALSKWHLQTLRKQIGVVLQSDTLLTGTIAQNIALFDDEIDMEHVRECARNACIHDEIEMMPMGYQTQVGDMGSTLSGGQNQRIFLARALYRRPKILLLDEATSHLDQKNENKILKSLSKLPITRIVIAHRKETIDSADRVIELNKGTVVTPVQIVSAEEMEGIKKKKALA